MAASSMLLWSLACAGLPAPAETRTWRALSIEVISGQVTDDTDLGAEGDHAVEWVSWTQNISWQRLEEDATPAGHAAELWEAMKIILEPLGAGAVPADVSIVPGEVDGQPSASFAASLDVGLRATVWACPTAGVLATLTTSGPASAVDERHERSLASVRCGTEPVGLDAAATTFVFRGDPAVWLPQPTEHPSEGRWEHRDGGVVLVVASVDALVDADVPGLCVGALRNVHALISPDYVLDEAASVYTETSGGCFHRWSGTRNADGAVVRGKFTHRTCDDYRGIMETCLVTAPELALDATCDGKVACAR